MSVSEHLRRTVALITAPGASAEQSTRPLGSGFFVSVLESHGEPPYLTRRHEYLVTAAHLVRRENRTFVRVRRSSERAGASNPQPDAVRAFEEVGIGRWFWSDDPSRDVAAAPLGFSVADFDHATIHLDRYRGDGEDTDEAGGVAVASVGLGDAVHVITLLTAATGSVRDAVPVVRSATLAATWERVPVEVEGSMPRTVTGHLLDTSGSAGAEGSPCFLFGDARAEEWPYIIQEARKLGDETLWRKALERHQETKFFGMVAGALPEAGGSGRRGASGIGVLVPREHVLSLIHSEAFRAQRAEDMRRAVEYERRGESVGTPGEGLPRRPHSTERFGTGSRRWR